MEENKEKTAVESGVWNGVAENGDGVDGGEEGALTFAALAKFAKLAALRTLVYLICSAVAAGVVSAGLWLFVPSDDTVSLRIEYLYGGIDGGLAPDKSAFDKDEIRSSAVLNAALGTFRAAAGGSDGITSVALLRDKVIIDGVLTDEYARLKADAEKGDAAAVAAWRDYKYFPTRFDIKIKKYRDLGLSEDGAKSLLSKIADAYRAYFKEKYYNAETFATDGYGLYKTDKAAYYDYIDFYDIYSAQFSAIGEELDRRNVEAAAFRSPATKKTFADLSNTRATVKNKLDEFNAFVLSKGVSKVTETVVINIAASISLSEKEKTRLESEKRYLTEQLSLYDHDTLVVTGADGTSTHNVYPEEYHNLQKLLTGVNASLAAVVKQIAVYTERLEAYEAALTDGDNAAAAAAAVRADGMLAFISGEADEFVTQVNLTLADYFEYKFGAGGATVTHPAAASRVKIIDIPYAFIFLAAALAAVAAALTVTQVKRQRAANKNKSNR